jgi:formylglycine-generating enzyme required for sulfatase activity
MRHQNSMVIRRQRKKLEEYAWYGAKLNDGPHEIRGKKPNQWGLYDMYGNVAEWTLDGWTENYRTVATRSKVDPWVAREKRSRWGVVRGGDWTAAPQDTRSASRGKEDDTASQSWTDSFEWWDLTDVGRRVGFRIVSPVNPEQDGRATSIPSQREHTQDGGQ